MNLYASVSLIEKMKFAEYFEKLSFGEKMLGSVVTAIMGMGITFIVLVILMYSIKAMGAILREKKAPAQKTAVPVAPAPAAAPKAAAAEAGDDEDEIAAVIAAAIAAQEGTRGFVIRNVYRAPSVSGWNAAGRSEAFDSRRTTIQKRS